RLRLRRGVRHRAQVPRDSPVPDRPDFHQPRALLHRGARPASAEVLLMSKLFFSLLAVISAQALAQEPFPTRAVKLIVPNAPGSSIDTMSRIVSAKLGDALGQSVFVENRDGAGGLIGVEAGKNAKPDGYTLICASNGSMIIAPLLRKSPPYDAVADFAAVGSFAVTPNVLIVNPDVPVKSARELIDYAKANPGKPNNATPGAQ